MAYADVEIRILKRDNNRYPVEITVDEEREYPRGYLDATAKPPNPTDAHYADVTYGQALFAWFFADEQLKENWAEIRGTYAQRRVRLRIDADEPTLHQVVWEALCEPQKGDLPELHLAAHSATPFSRYLAGKSLPGKPILRRPIQVLVVAPAQADFEQVYPRDKNPDMALIEPEKEFQALQAAAKPLIDQKLVELALLPQPCTLAAIAKELMQGYHVLHLICHGQYSENTQRTRLILADSSNKVEPELDTDITAMLAQQFTEANVEDESTLRLVFLASCETGKRSSADAFRGLAPQLVAAGIPAIVAMQDQVGEQTARAFAAMFYARLLVHGQVDLASNEARQIVMAAKLPGPVIPVLYMRLKTGELASADRVWAALRAIRDHADYADFRTRKYVQLPLQAVQVNEGHNIGRHEQAGPQRVGTLDLLGAVMSHLAADRAPTPRPTSTPSLVLVLGGPGTSKSTQMKQLGWETVQAGLESPAGGFFLPLYLSLRDYRPGGSATAETLEGRILDRLRLFLPDLAARTLDELSKQMRRVRLRILLSAGDTLPEVGRDLVRQAVALARGYPEHQYVLAIQPSSLNWDDLKGQHKVRCYVLAIQLLEQRGIRHFLEAQGRPGQRLLDALYDTSLFDLASTPFFLVKMLAKARQRLYPNSRAKILEQLISEAMAQIPADRGMRTNAPRTVFALALEMQKSGLATWPIGEAFRVMDGQRGERGYAVEELYPSLVEQELLLPVGEDAVRFAYRSIQAYCCAKAILALPERDQYLGQIVDSLGSPVRWRSWEETLVVVSGLLAADPRADAQQTLQHLLEPMVYGANLLQGVPVFLAARCLLECRPVHHKKEMRKLVEHVVNALQWRSDSAFEPDLGARLQATQLLAQLAMPEIAVDLARRTYERVRKNVAEEWDYEFSSVRFAAAIALKRMTPAAAETALAQICSGLVGLFAAWQRKDVDELIRQSECPDDLGLQGLAALALGDLQGPLASEVPPITAARVLDRLIEMFKSDETRQNVRWAVADALSLLDSALVTESLVAPLLSEFSSPNGTSLRDQAKIRKTLAYLIGLLRPHDYRNGARNFLVQNCLGLEGGSGSKDWSTWATAIVALGRIAAESDKKLLAEIASGRSKDMDLRQRFRNEAQRDYIRREAINALANQGDLDVLSPEDRDSLAREPALCRAYYQAVQEIYWRRVAASAAAQ